ncbi:MAG: glycosyltransferase [Methanocalculus sp. MSAO_Arc1]|uniref:glycosyltransferase n=1 Tax=Methanocalculus TaxID=71151 RepID=UPI000FEE0309|nr:MULTISPECIES: glycosyltransferase [unclassified Methanocalculus]MCP1661964.1 glycosyltransferase involved in cell wall biosynthesis [Methanocalculus sp. AMF5]RQD81158.1 MAG: glycosyltransferase [Methanocalculus sp. MSAO_Arc1]
MISIIIPTYNEESNIEQCLQSLSNQSLPRSSYEIIVVDGNSHDRTREIAEAYADLVFIQTSKKVGGARNDGAELSKGDIIATTDADCIIPHNWLARIEAGFIDPRVVQLYGLVEPIEPGIQHKISLGLANTFSRLGYYSGTLYYTLGCNTAFRREAFFEAGQYRTIDAGDDLEIARRMRQIGCVKLDKNLRVQFSMRRYVQFGTLKSLYEWVYITAKGGDDETYQYSKREYK